MVPVARSTFSAVCCGGLRQPWVAGPLWILILYGWHFAPAYEAALRRPEPSTPSSTRASSSGRFSCGSRCSSRRAAGSRAALWKIGHIGGVRLAGMFLGMAFFIVQRPIYEGFYGQRALQHGMTPLQDQQIAGGMMLGLDFLVMIGALIFFFLRTAEDADRDEARERGRRPMQRQELDRYRDTAGKVGALGKQIREG